jgi:hypothetical protein
MTTEFADARTKNASSGGIENEWTGGTVLPPFEDLKYPPAYHNHPIIYE